MVDKPFQCSVRKQISIRKRHLNTIMGSIPYLYANFTLSNSTSIQSFSHSKQAVAYKSHRLTPQTLSLSLSVAWSWLTACHAYIRMKQARQLSFTFPLVSQCLCGRKKIPWRTFFVKYIWTVWVRLNDIHITQPLDTVRGGTRTCLWKLQYGD